MGEEVQGLESKFTQEGAMFGGKRRKRGKSKSRKTRRRMRGGAGAGMKPEGNSEVMMGGKSRRKKRKGRKGKKSRSSRK
jgi:hypothetical protein